MNSNLLPALLVLIGFSWPSARAAELHFARPRTYRVMTPDDPWHVYAALTRFLIATGIEDHENHARMGSNFGDPNQLHVEVSETNETRVFHWCAENDCTLEVAYAVDPPPDYSDFAVRRRFDGINERLRTLAVDVLENSEASSKVAEFRTWFDGVSQSIPYEGGSVDLSREITALERAARNLVPPDLGPLASPRLPRGPISLPPGVDEPHLNAVVDRFNAFSQADWARFAKAKPQYRAIVEGYQKELAHQQATSEDMRWLEARLKSVDEIVFRALYPLDEKRMNSETYEVAAEGVHRTLDALERARDEGRLSEFEILDSLDRQLTLSDRWIVGLPPLGPRLAGLFRRLAGREGLNPYFRLLFAASVGDVPREAERTAYADLERALASRPVKNVPGFYVHVLHYGQLHNFVAGSVDHPVHRGLVFIDRWMANHGVAPRDWADRPGPPIDILRSRFADARRAHLRSLGLDGCGSYLDEILGPK